MAKLETIWLSKGGPKGNEIRLKWGNNRQQAVHMGAVSPTEVIEAFEELVNLLRSEHYHDKI